MVGNVIFMPKQDTYEGRGSLAQGFVGILVSVQCPCTSSKQQKNTPTYPITPCMEDVDFVGVSLSKSLFLQTCVDLKSRRHTSTDTLPQYFSKVGNRRVSTFGPMVQQGHNTGTGGLSSILIRPRSRRRPLGLDDGLR